ncbi:hypothetical protein BGZ98_009395 [Dissophora globulifera]|nr:hypothetical protein BGZ98_009395 [Dissophora globulifera]
MASEALSIDALKSRLSVCRQQLEGNSLLNTPKRKDALRDEISSIEKQLAEALGIQDDDDSDYDTPVKNESGTLTPDPVHERSINSPGGTRSPSPLADSPSSYRWEVKREYTPGSSSTSAVVGKEAESVMSALVDAGEDDMDLDALLKEQALMEQRLADLKRRREEEDELFARSMQEEEIRTFQRRNPSSTSATALSLGSSTGSPAASLIQSSLDRARQERMDEEMARIFAESENSSISYNLAASPQKSIPQPISNTTSVQPARPSFSIFEKRAKTSATAPAASTVSPTVPSSSALLNAGLVHKPAAPGTHIVSQTGPSVAPGATAVDPSTMSIPATIAALGSNIDLVYNRLTGLLATATTPQRRQEVMAMRQMLDKLRQKQQTPPQPSQMPQQRPQPTNPTSRLSQQSSQTNRHIDLTKPVVDLTKQVYDISSSDDEQRAGPSSRPSNGPLSVNHNNFDPIVRSFGSLSAGAASGFSGYGGHAYGSDRFYDDDDEEDEDDEGFGYDGYGFGYTSSYDKWMDRQRSFDQEMLWSQPRDSSRNLSAAQSEKELRDLLANIQASEEEIAPKDRTGTPEGMAAHIALLEHQKIGLTWLTKMETGTNKGGILADDMGLGKTIQSMALIVSRPCGPIDDPVIWDDRQEYYQPPPKSKLVQTKATLVIAPVGLVYQWAEELRSKTLPGLLKIHIYHGGSKFNDPELLRRYDVVITTPATLVNDAGIRDARKVRPIGTLFKAHFHRVILDEAHIIKNKTTRSSLACAQISATYRWCLTGTPIQNNVDELFSLIRFLGIKPYCDWDEFRDKISSPMKKTLQYGPAMQRVQALLKAVCLRRTKTSQVDGKPILQLPQRNVEKVETPFSVDERSFYIALEQRTRDRFNAYVKAGTVMKNYSNILVLLLRMRQACCHPHLINDFEKITDETTPEDKKSHVTHLLDNLMEDIRRRLIERGLDAIECPICMDVGEESVILSGCGHIYCRACITAHLSRHEEEDRKCPECRRNSPIDDLISVADFNARYNPDPVPEAAALDDPKGKGKGKAVDTEGEDNLDKALKVVVPEELDEWISSSKIDKMVDIVKNVIAKGEKIIVFSQFTSLLTLIAKPLLAEKIKYLRYDGAMTMEARNEAVVRISTDPTISVMLISLKCGSLGLNLTVANHVVIMDPWWNPALENQAIDRVHRIGQTKDVYVHRLCIPETVEDRILALQAKKQALSDGALGEGEVPKLAKLGLQELMYLFRAG